MKKGSTLGNLPTYESIYESTDVLGLPRRMVRGALSTLAKGYVTNKGNSVILTGRTKPVLIGSAVDDEQDDGQPRSS